MRESRWAGGLNGDNGVAWSFLRRGGPEEGASSGKN